MSESKQTDMSFRLLLQSEEGKQSAPAKQSLELGGLLVALRRRGMFLIAQARLAASAGVLLTVAEDIEEFCIILTENDASDRTATIYLYQPGGSASTSTVIANALPIPIGQPYIFAPGVGLRRGQVLSALCSNANSVTASVFARPEK